MGHLRSRIRGTSDSYYVNSEGYRDARSRTHSNRFNDKMNVFVILVGFILIVGYFQMKIGWMLTWGLGVFLFGCLTTWLTHRKRMNE